jgi:hypothetical protein
MTRSIGPERAGLNISRVSAVALAEELDRRAKIAALDSYLRELDAELGPIPTDEQLAAGRHGGPHE